LGKPNRCSKEYPEVNQEEKHLSIEQIECLIETQPGVTESHAQSGSLEEARCHLANCEICQKLVSMHRQCQRTLRQLGEEGSSKVARDCPSQESLNKLAAGISNSEEAEIVLQHCAACDYCGSLLRQAMEYFADAGTPEEESMLAALETSQPAWQRRFGAILAKQSVADVKESDDLNARVSGKSVGFALAPRWVYAIAATVLFAIAGLGWARWRSSPTYAERLLARAYAEQRTMEPRFTGAGHGPMRVERGGESSRLSHPAALLEVEALVARKIAEHPEDPSWLQSRGRIDLLEGNYDAAMEALQRAVEIEPRSAEILTDLATAYFQQAELRKQAVYYSHALELLGQALAIKPDDPVALFNRAINEERLFLYQQAVDDWLRYLRLDPTGAWAEEARARLAGAQKILKNRENNSGRHLMDGPQLNSYLSSENQRGIDAVNARIEDYGKMAVRSWLREAFPAAGGKRQNGRSEEARSALLALASIAKSRHGDLWFEDLLKGSRTPLFAEAAQSLSKALLADDEGNYVLALSAARQSEVLFQRAGNSAGLYAAEVEEVAALRLTDAEGHCAERAVTLTQKLRGRHYVWLGSELALEYAICSELLGNEGTAQKIATRTVADTRKANYTTAYLRALTVLAGLDRSAGKESESWQEANNGLSLFWAGQYPAMRGYSLQAQMELLAEDSRDWFLQATILQEAVRLIDTEPDLLLRSVAHDRLARAAMQAGMPAVAQINFQTARRLFAECPQNQATKARQADAEILSVRADLRSGDRENAGDRLEGVRQALLNSSYGYALVDFFEVKAEMLGDRGDVSGAELSLASALALTEKRLRSVDSERDRILWDRENSSVYRSLVSLLLHEERGSDALEVWEWYRGAPLRSGDGPFSTPIPKSDQADGEGSLSDLESHPLKPLTGTLNQHLRNLKKETVVSYAFLSGGLAVWVFDDRGIHWQWISKTPETIERQGRHFRKLCEDPRSDMSILRAESRALYDLLIAPVSDHLTPDRTVVLEGDGSIAQIPMQVLVDRQGRYLDERFDVDWSPGFEYEIGLRPGIPFSEHSSALVVATAEALGAEWGERKALPDAVAEGRSVSELFPAARLLVGEQVTLAHVKQHLGGAAIFHFAGHASAGTELGGLLLRRNSAEKNGLEVLSASELNAKRLKNLDLAVLSACSTELGANEGITDPASVARAFLRAGVPHVVASRWAVDSRSARNFMDYFYGMLVAGNSVPHSLRIAGNKLRMGRDTSHPFYWAAFNCFGRG
jgi:CHAT domain-containing protein/cytochrome c-type biogenesis protein CcmH/NrfG